MSRSRLLVGCGAAFTLLFTLSSLAAETAFASPPEKGNKRQRSGYGCGKANALAKKYLSEERGSPNPAASSAGPREAFEDTDLLHCNLEIEVLPGQTNNIIGTNELKIQSKSASLAEFTFRLRSQYTITSATISPNPGGGGTAVSVSTVDTVTRVATLDRTYTMDEIFYLTIDYTGHAESRGFGSIEFTTHNGEDIVYTLSEPYFSYTWWPAKDGDYADPGDNGDKFTLELSVIAPDTMVTASNGLLQGIDSLSGNRERYRWASNYPIAPYLVCFSTTNYNTWQVNYNKMAGGTMPVDFYIYPEDDTTGNRNAWEEVVQMMYTLRDLYGEYPFVDEKYGIYECEFGGGMEHQTFTAQGTFLDWVTVHELSHQWWGDMITCKHWNDIWLNEGFATYTEALWEEFKPGSSGLPALKADMAAKKYFGGGSVYVTTAEVGDPNSIFNGNTTYDKGGWVLHMLRHVLGSSTFFDMLAAYRAAYEGSAATTADFQAICEQFYPGGDLDWFFQEWVFGEYAPTYQYGWQSLQVNGNHYLALYINQTQLSSIQRFSMPIDILVNSSDTYVVFNDNDPEHFVIPLPSAAAAVSFDPDEWILREGLSTTGYVAGPPKIVETSPMPGDFVACGTNLDTVTVTFHTNVSTSAAHYSLVGAVNGAQSVSFSYDGGNNTVTLTSTGPLPADDYTLTVNDALTALNSGQQLDGEIADASDPASLPSGEGVAGGSAVIEFTVEGALIGDIDGDCDRDQTDVVFFVNVLLGLEQNEPYYSNSDINGSGLPPDGDDIQLFVNAMVGS